MGRPKGSKNKKKSDGLGLGFALLKMTAGFAWSTVKPKRLRSAPAYRITNGFGAPQTTKSKKRKR